MPSPQQRLRRFKREPQAAGLFKIMPRDIEILRHVAEHRFIRSGWLIKLVGGSPQQVLRRLHLLYHHGYLERPRAQLDYFHEGGSRSLVYGLASRGAGRLRRDLDMPFHRMDWTNRSKSVGRLFLEHALMVSDFMAALELDCRNRPGVQLLYSHDLPIPTGREARREPFRWTIDLPGKRRVGVVPDKVFALELTHSGGRIEKTHYFLEADRGTMPIERRDLRQSCIARKLNAYRATGASTMHRARLGAERFIVLTIASREARAEHIAQAVSKLESGQRFFRVFGEAAWRAAENRLDLILQSTGSAVLPAQ